LPFTDLLREDQGEGTSDGHNVRTSDGSKGTPVKRNNVLKLAVVVAATVLPLTAASQAFADYAPQSGDVVGVGGDTPQYATDFLVNGDTNGDLGFDSSTGVNRVIPFDATADANGRQAYAPGSTEASPIPLNPTVVLRAGTSPVQRPQSSAQAIEALEADTKSTETINFVTSASAPTATGQGTVPAGGLDYVKFATDSIEIAVDTVGTNAPAGLTALQLANIYDGTWTTWDQVENNNTSDIGGGTIIPEIPPSTSSVYSNFVKALTAVDSGFSVNSADTQVEQNDPTAITGASTPANAIVPFSAGRLNLWNGTAGTDNKGYFYNPATPFPGSSTPLSPGVSLLTGTAPGGGASLDIAINDYAIWRAADTTSTTPYQPGGALNWVQTLFWDPSGPTPYLFTGHSGPPPARRTLLALL
jgi:ABC-type phosphate transport system substrate-binding protein